MYVPQTSQICTSRPTEMKSLNHADDPNSRGQICHLLELLNRTNVALERRDNEINCLKRAIYAICWA